MADDKVDLLHCLLLPGDLLIQILVRLPVESLSRFKAVCKSWRTLLDDPSFIDRSTPSRFGSFILHAAAKFGRFRENALVMLSSSESGTYFGSNGVSGQCVSRSEFSSSSSSSHWWSNGSNGVCGRCVSSSESGSWFNWGKTVDGLCVKCGQWSSYSVTEFDDPVFKLDDYDQQLVLKLDNLGGFPSCYNFGAFKPIYVIGSCNGLICLHDNLSNDVSLFNPTTKQFRILPKSIPKIILDGEDRRPHHLVAFGFDHETKDHKVVLLTVSQPLYYLGPVKHKQCACRIQIYSLTTDSWRVLEGINVLPGYPLNQPNSVLYLNGSCFFMAEFLNFKPDKKEVGPVNNRFVISFDLTREIIIPIQLPNHHQGQELYLCYLGEKIALFTAECYVRVDKYTSNCVRYDDFKSFGADVTGCYEEFTIWVLNEYGGGSDNVSKKSWRQLHLFRIKHVPGEWHIPRGISNDGEFVLLETRDMYGGKGGKKMMKLFNLVSYQVKKKFLSCDEVMSIANAYKPSLVSIVGGNGCNSNSNSG